MYQIQANHEKKPDGKAEERHSPVIWTLHHHTVQYWPADSYNLFAVLSFGSVAMAVDHLKDHRLKGIRAERVSQLWRRWYAWGDRYLWCWLHNRWSRQWTCICQPEWISFSLNLFCLSIHITMRLSQTLVFFIASLSQHSTKRSDENISGCVTY